MCGTELWDTELEVKTELGLDTALGADMELGPDMELDCDPSGGETALAF